MLKVRKECIDKHLSTWQKIKEGSCQFGPEKKDYRDYETWIAIIKKETDLLFKYAKGKANGREIITNLVRTEADLEEYRAICDRVCRDLREKIDQITGGEQTCKA